MISADEINRELVNNDNFRCYIFVDTFALFSFECEVAKSNSLLVCFKVGYCSVNGNVSFRSCHVHVYKNR